MQHIPVEVIHVAASWGRTTIFWKSISQDAWMRMVVGDQIGKESRTTVMPFCAGKRQKVVAGAFVLLLL